MSSPANFLLRASASRRVRIAALAAGCGIAVAAAAAFGVAAPLSPSPAAQAAAARLPDFAGLVKKVMPAVVNISVKEKAGPVAEEGEIGPEGGQPFFPQSPFNQFLRKFFNQPGPGAPPEGAGALTALGSGFIIDPSGYVVTNNHVVANAETVTVIFQDGSQHPAKVIGRDPKTDLALLKIDAKHPLPFVRWGNSDTAEVGDWVMAVGNPFGLGGTVSSGIVSARHREIPDGEYDQFIQIDAAINRGNSGGPTFNLNGQVIGINTAIYSPNGGSVGIAFDIPSNLAKPVIEQLKEHGKVVRSWIGADIQEVTPAIARSFGLPKPEGALVTDVVHGGPAAKAGLKQGDIILSFDDTDIAKMHDLPITVANTPVGTKADITVWRDHRKLTLEATTALMPAQPMLAENGGAAAMGLTFEPLTPSRRESLGVGKKIKGVVVAAISPNSPLAALGLQQGDVIEAINRQPADTPQQAVALLNKTRHEKGAKKSILILLDRHGVSQYVAMTVEDNGASG
jgi:serine protease Do